MLCLGILYHLEATEVVRLVHTVADITRRLVVFDTHVAMAARSRVTIDGRTYWGRRIREFHPRTPPETQERLSRSSIGNAESFWLTRASLFNLLSDAGFTSVAEVHVPRARSTGDRVTLLAFRGTPRTVISAPDAEGLDARWPERERDTVHSSATWRGAVKVRLAPHIPAPLKRCVRWLRTRR